MRLSIIIPTRGRTNLLKQCIDSIKKHTEDFEIIIEDENLGYNAKVNKGMRKANGDYLVVLHNDHIVTKGWSDVLCDVGSFMQGEMNDSFIHWGGFYRPVERYCININDTPDYPSMFVFSKDAYKKIGEFDEFFEEPGYQDVDLGYQIKKAGYKIKCLPGKIIHRCVGRTPLNETNKEYLHKKWGIC